MGRWTLQRRTQWRTQWLQYRWQWMGAVQLVRRIFGAKRATTEMSMVNSETVAGRNIAAVHGLVMGNTIRSKHIGKDIGAGLKTSSSASSRATPPC